MTGVDASRLVTGLTLLLAVGGLTAAVSLADSREPAPVTGRPVPLESPDAVLTCAAPPRLLESGDAVDTDEELLATAETDTHLTAVAGGGSGPPALTVTAPGGVTRAEPGGWLAAAAAGPEGPAVVRAAGGHGAGGRVAALATAVTPDGDLRGLAGSACAAPTEEAWLVGGGTVVGRSARLEVTNPAPTPATVDVTVLTPGGPLRPPAGQGVVLAAGESSEVLIEGLAPGAASLAVGVSSSGARVGAALVDTWLDGLTPRGVETVVAGAGPATRQVVPGVVGLAGGPEPILRIAVPGTEDAVARWQVRGPSGVVVPQGPPAATVAAGTVVDVPLEGLAPGAYTVVVDADVPVLAAGSTVSGEREASQGPADVAWGAGAMPLTGRSLVALPGAAVRPRLVLSAGEEATAVHVEALDGEGATTASRTVRVPAASTATLDLSALPARSVAAVLDVAGDAVEVHAALLLTASASSGPDLVSVVPVSAEEPRADSLPVRTPPDGRWP